MTKEQFRRKSELESLLFVPRTEAEKKKSVHQVSPDGVREFLRLAALSHQAYCQYTNLDALKGMLKSGRLHLSLVASLNDLFEFKAGESGARSYVASFCFGHVENVAMWWMYGYKGDTKRSAVRIKFPGKAMQIWAEEMMSPATLDHLDRDIRIYGEKGKKLSSDRLPCPVSSVSFHDVVYQYGRGRELEGGKRKRGSVFWNGKVAGDIRCKAFSDATRCPHLVSCVKDFGWSYENETRLVITLAEPHPEIKRISVPFATVLSGISVMSAPTSVEEGKEGPMNRIVEALIQCDKHPDIPTDIDWKARVFASDYSVRFQ